MNTSFIQDRKSEKGFTLVELAIVLIIVGLLITGVLKGQELIANAEVASAASFVRSVDAASTTFDDSYNAFPGDMSQANARARIPNCAACTGGDGDSTLEVAPGAAANAGESLAFWDHLSGADLIINDNPGGTPTTPVDGFATAAFHPGGALGNGGGTVSRGHFISLGDAMGTGGALRITQAARLDRKTDDGVANTGTTQADAGCHTMGVYDEAADNAVCLLSLGLSN